MAKAAFLGGTIGIDDSAGSLKQLENDITSLSFNTDREAVDVSGLDKLAIERLSLRANGSVSLTLEFNDASSRSFDVFKNTANTRTFTLIVGGQTLTMEMVIESVAWAVDSSGRFTLQVSMSLQDGTVPVWS